MLFHQSQLKPDRYKGIRASPKWIRKTFRFSSVTTDRFLVLSKNEALGSVFIRQSVYVLKHIRAGFMSDNFRVNSLLWKFAIISWIIVLNQLIQESNGLHSVLALFP